MTVIGIDYGEKRVGVALSDATETLAFPKTVIENSAALVSTIAQLCMREHARLVVLGQSLDFKGKENPIMQGVSKLKHGLEGGGLPVALEPEFFSSAEAERFTGANSEIDAAAAAIILQRFLDKQRARATLEA